MDDGKPIGGVGGWTFGFVLGFILPAAAAFVAFLFTHSPAPGASKWPFFACLFSSGLLVMLGLRGWRRWTLAQGLTLGAGLWLAALPFFTGSCLE